MSEVYKDSLMQHQAIFSLMLHRRAVSEFGKNVVVFASGDAEEEDESLTK